MKNKVYIIVGMTMVALMLTLGAYAQDQDQDQEEGIEITISNDSEMSKKGNKLMFILDSETKEGKKNPGKTFTIEAGKEKTVTMPADTVKLNISSSQSNR